MIPRNHESVLLAKKGRGFGKGKWVGFGGKREPHESIDAAAKREILEETGVVLSNIRKVGLLLFTFDCEPGLYLEVHVYDTKESFESVGLNDEYEGHAVWYNKERIPYKVLLLIRAALCWLAWLRGKAFDC